jgi:hypothetical protein
MRHTANDSPSVRNSQKAKDKASPACLRWRASFEPGPDYDLHDERSAKLAGPLVTIARGTTTQRRLGLLFWKIRASKEHEDPNTLLTAEATRLIGGNGRKEPRTAIGRDDAQSKGPVMHAGQSTDKLEKGEWKHSRINDIKEKTNMAGAGIC